MKTTNDHIYITECPRDAMQGIPSFIPTEQKIAYLNSLLRVGFDTLDFGSFVSPKAVPQMADTLEVLKHLEWQESPTKLAAVIVNQMGLDIACGVEGVDILGYPFSISETFQLRNSRKNLKESLALVKAIQKKAHETGKALRIYLSMAFGNPYGDEWKLEIVERWIEEMLGLGISNIVLADTIGSSEADQINEMFEHFIPKFPSAHLGAHFHSHPTQASEKIAAAWKGGCRLFDVAMMGFGGCPFAKDELVGNIATEKLLEFCREEKIPLGLDEGALVKSQSLAAQIFLTS